MSRLQNVLRKQWVQPRTIRFRLLLTVYATMAVLVTVFLAIDYQRELSGRLAQTRVALDEEAKTIIPAVLRLRQEGTVAVQRYLDAVCGRMRDAQSPGHHIAVRLDGQVIQATAHRRDSPELFDVIVRAARSSDRRGEISGRELMVGSAETAGVTAYVSEELGLLQQAVLGLMLWRLAGMLALGFVAALLASAILLEIVAKPLNRLVATVDQIAAGKFVARPPAFKSVELTALSDAINTMANSLESADLHRRQELAQARRIQEHLLPQESDIPGMNLTAFFRPASDVAGDYFDVIPLSDGACLLCIADVSGHGIPAAMSAATLKAFLQHAVERHSAPEKLLAFMNRRFAAISPPELFASMLLVRCDLDNGSLTYASAGHEPAWLVRPGDEPEMLEATGFPLGVDADATWTARTVFAGAGTQLLLLTDGVPESFSPDQELFGRDRLKHFLIAVRDKPLGEWLDELDRALAAHRNDAPPADDATFVAIEFHGQEGGSQGSGLGHGTFSAAI